MKIAINGFGRIGRAITRVALEHNLEIVSINDLMNIKMMEYLFRFDSVHCLKNYDIKIDNDYLIINDQKIKITHFSHPKDIEFDADVVIEATGKFLTSDDVCFHLEKKAKKVIISAPATDDTKTFVLGVNEKEYNGESIISNGSCTTNCLGVVAKILDEHFGIEKGLMTTIHSYTYDQNLLDNFHKGDPRRARAASVNIVPTSTGAAKAIYKVMPNLKGKLHGQSVRVPVANVSMVDLNVVLSKSTTKEEINQLFLNYSNTTLKGLLGVDDKFMVSSDLIGNSNSAIVALDLTQVIENNLAKVMIWYDNEWGYSNRIIEMAKYISNL